MREMINAVVEIPLDNILNCRKCRFYIFIKKNGHFMVACNISTYGNAECKNMDDEEKAIELMRSKCPFLNNIKDVKESNKPNIKPPGQDPKGKRK